MEAQLLKQRAEEPEVKRPNLTGIPTQMKLDFERRSGLSFDDVRVHYNSDKPARLGALAYTQGNQIHVGPGQERSLPHELGHVIQQKAGKVRPTRWVGGLPVNDQPELEREADLAPVQCMQAPALWGVVQMDLEVMPHQNGCNCGYHALARALLRFIPPGHRYNSNNLEKQLTSFAIQTGFSVIGEAFDPHALAHVGNEFCRTEGIHARCSVRAFNTAFALSELLNSSYGTGSVILLPYFPEPGSMRVGQNDPLAPRENAHWSAIDTIGGIPYKLYEGNLHGSTGRSQAGPPADVTPGDLFQSNQSISPQFNWDTFLISQGLRQYRISDPPPQTGWTSNSIYLALKRYYPSVPDPSRLDYTRWMSGKGLTAVNIKKGNVITDPSAPNSGQFPDVAAFRQHIQTVIQNINQNAGRPNPAFTGTQSVFLQGLAVEVSG